MADDVFGGEPDLIVRMEKGRTRIVNVFIPWCREQIRLMNNQLLLVPVYPTFYQRTIDKLLANTSINYVEQRADPVYDDNHEMVRGQMEMVFYVGAKWRKADGTINGDGIGVWISKGEKQTALTEPIDTQLYPTGTPWPEG